MSAILIEQLDFQTLELCALFWKPTCDTVQILTLRIASGVISLYGYMRNSRH